MRLRRRDLLLGLGAATLAGCARRAAPARAPASQPAPAPAPAPAARTEPPKPKRILVLGGTGFVGPALVRAAIARGHTLTLFNRGKTNPGLFPDVETILGDRVTELDKLAGRDWDAVVDTWAPGPTLVRRAAELLRDRVAQYVFVSTISVYKLGKEPFDESSPVLTLPPGTDLKSIHTIDASNYGALKAMAEDAAEAAMPGRTTRVRPGVIVGPGDPTDRFLYWPERMSRGGEMIAPGTPGDRMQLVDVRDLGEWMVSTIEKKTTGVYDAVGPDDPVLGHVLDEIRAAVASDVRLAWIPTKWLEANDAAGWKSFPLAVGNDDEEAGFGHVSAARAIAAGLRFRAVGESAKDALAWWRAQPDARRSQERPGLTAAREAELLARFRAGPPAAASRR